MNDKTGFVCIHGAGLNASIWDKLKKELDSPILAIDFPNRKTNDNANSEKSFVDYVDASIEQINQWDTKNFIIVAHSIGACVGLKIANHFSNELKGFVALSAIIPTDGQSFISSLPFPQKWILPLILRLFGTKPPQKSIENELCNDLTAEQTLKIMHEFSPESKALYTTKINYQLPETKRLYIKLTNDKSMPIDLQNSMAKNLQATQIATLDSGHLPMLSKAKELVLILSEFLNTVYQEDKLTNR